MPIVEVNPPNPWRTETPGHEGWQHTARRTDAKNAASFFGFEVPEHQRLEAYL